jgi:hypothetical protein
MNHALVVLLLFQLSAHPRHLVYVEDEVLHSGALQVYENTSRGREDDNHTAPAVSKEFEDHCQSISFTDDKSAAEFILQTQNGRLYLLNRQGSVLHSASAKTLRNRAKEVCSFVSTH